MLMILARTTLRMKRMKWMGTWLTTNLLTLWPPQTSSMDLFWQQKQKKIPNCRSCSNDRVPPVMRYSTMQNLVFPIKTANRFGITNCVAIFAKVSRFRATPPLHPLAQLRARCGGFSPDVSLSSLSPWASSPSCPTPTWCWSPWSSSSSPCSSSRVTSSSDSRSCRRKLTQPESLKQQLNNWLAGRMYFIHIPPKRSRNI